MSYVGSGDPPGEDCLLCSMVEGAAGASEHVVERAATTISVLNRFPYSSGHTMIVPARHVTVVEDLTATESADLLAAASRVMTALTEEMHPDGFNLGINQGRAAGGSLPHLHLHVVPRWSGDTNFMPVLADVKVMPEHLDATAEHLRARLASDRGPSAST